MNVEIASVKQNNLKLYWRVYFLESINDCGTRKIRWFGRTWKVSTLVFFKLLSYKMRKKKLEHFEILSYFVPYSEGRLIC